MASMDAEIVVRVDQDSLEELKKLVARIEKAVEDMGRLVGALETKAAKTEEL
jgi:hypothetical protein